MSDPAEKQNGSTVEVAFSSDAVLPAKEEVAHSLGYGELPLPEHFGDIIDSVLERSAQLCSVAAGYKIFPLAVEKARLDGLWVDGVFFTMHQVITPQLRNATQAALFVCTIGKALENWSTSLCAEGELVCSYFVDAIASLAVEKAADLLQLHLEKHMLSRSLRVTNRYSPGYCGWTLADQRLLFKSLPVDFCGVQLGDSALMVPRKSVSGIVGIGTRVRNNPYFCKQCKNTSCTYRSYLAGKKTKRKQQ